MARRRSLSVALAFAASLVNAMTVCAVLAACAPVSAHHCGEPTTPSAATLSVPDCCAMGPQVDHRDPLGVTVQAAPVPPRIWTFVLPAAALDAGVRPTPSTPLFSPDRLYLSQRSLLI